MGGSTRETIGRELTMLADELEEIQVRQEEIYERRLELWLQGRALTPGMTHLELSIPARVTEGAVTQALRKHRLQSNGSR